MYVFDNVNLDLFGNSYMIIGKNSVILFSFLCVCTVAE